MSTTAFGRRFHAGALALHAAEQACKNVAGGLLVAGDLGFTFFKSSQEVAEWHAAHVAPTEFMGVVAAWAEVARSDRPSCIAVQVNSGPALGEAGSQVWPGTETMHDDAATDLLIDEAVVLVGEALGRSVARAMFALSRSQDQRGTLVRLVLKRGPVLPNQAARSGFLARLLASARVQQLVRCGVLEVAPFYRYGEHISLPLCPGAGGAAFVPDGASEWTAEALEHYTVTVVPAGAEVASFEPASLGPLFKDAEHVLAYCSRRGFHFTPQDVRVAGAAEAGFVLRLDPRASFTCPARVVHPARTEVLLLVSGDGVTLVCCGLPRHGARPGDVVCGQRACFRTGHTECCSLFLGLLAPPLFEPTPVPPRLVDGVPRAAALEGTNLVVCDHCGCGKTVAGCETVVQHVLAERRAGRAVWVVVVASHVGLVESMVANLNVHLRRAGLEGAKDYVAHKELLSGVVVICAPSVHKLERGLLRPRTPTSARLLVLFDEPVAALKMIASMRSARNVSAEDQLRGLALLFQKASRLVLCDADATPDNVGLLLRSAGVRDVTYRRTQLQPFQGQKATFVLGYSVGADGGPRIQCWTSAVFLGRLLRQPERLSIFVPVSEVKIGLVLADYCRVRHPDVECHFLWAKSPNKRELVELFTGMRPGRQVVFIASPALTTGVSHDHGAFGVVMEVLAAFTTSATDSGQRVARPRPFQGRTPRLYQVIADPNIALADLARWEELKFDKATVVDEDLRAFIQARTLADASSLAKARGWLRMADFKARFGVGPPPDCDARFVHTSRGDYLLQRAPARGLHSKAEIVDQVTRHSRLATATRKVSAGATPAYAAVCRAAKDVTRAVTGCADLDALLCAPAVDAANRARTILEDIRQRHVAAGRDLSEPFELLELGEEDDEWQVLEMCSKRASELGVADYDAKAVYARTRFFCYGDGGRFPSREAQWRAMLDAEAERNDPKRARLAARAPDDALPEAEEELRGRDDPDRPLEEIHAEWERDLWYQALCFGELAVLDVCLQIEAPELQEDGFADAKAEWTRMHRFGVQAAFVALAEYRRSPPDQGGGHAWANNLARAYPQVRGDVPAYIKAAQLETLLVACGFADGWRGNDRVAGFKDKPTEAGDVDAKRRMVEALNDVREKGSCFLTSRSLMKTVQQEVSSLQCLVTVEKAVCPTSHDVFEVKRSAILDRYMFGEQFQAEEHGLAWRGALFKQFRAARP